MEKLTDVLAMGGYGQYVWPAFLVTLLVLAAMALFSLKMLKRSQKTLANLAEYSSSNEA